jgi:hypothetical protein
MALGRTIVNSLGASSPVPWRGAGRLVKGDAGAVPSIRRKEILDGRRLKGLKLAEMMSVIPLA